MGFMVEAPMRAAYAGLVAPLTAKDTGRRFRVCTGGAIGVASRTNMAGHLSGNAVQGKHVPFSMQQERRRFLRQTLEAPLMVRSIGSTAVHAHRGHCVDLNPYGTAGLIPGEWRPGQVVTMELTLPGIDRALILTGRVCYREELRCGFEFLAPSSEAVDLLRSVCA